MHISELVGKTFTQIVINDEKTEILFHSEDGVFKMNGYSDGGDVWVDDVDGDLETLLNSPILLAEEKKSEAEHKKGRPCETYPQWHFYEIATIKGNATIRWYAEAGTYYAAQMGLNKVS